MYRGARIKNDAALRLKLLGAMEVRLLMREWFRNAGVLEVETPTLVRAPGQEPYLEPFETIVRDTRGVETPAFLITSPEYALKKLLAAGFANVFEITRCYRNEEPTGGLHNPEFTMLEWYRSGASYRDIMTDCENLVSFIAKKLPITNYQSPSSFFSPPWERLSVTEAFQRYADTNLESVTNDIDFFKIFLTKIEQKLGQEKPTILYDYPARMAALARIKPDDGRYAERFEVYIRGVEIANAFGELTDAEEQRRRFVHEQTTRRAERKKVHPMDEEFLAALEAGLPPCAGIALGVDRLCMILLDAASIDEVRFFPW